MTDLFKRITVQGKRQPMDSAPRTREVILFATNGIRMISQWYDTKCGWGENKVEGGYYFDDYFEGWMEVPDGDEPSCDGD